MSDSIESVSIRFYQAQIESMESERDALWAITQDPLIRADWAKWGEALDDYYGAECAVRCAEKMLERAKQAEAARANPPAA